MEDDTYVFHTNNPDFSSVCTTCGSPNHSVSVAHTPLSSFESSNSFSILSPEPESLDSGSQRGFPSRTCYPGNKQTPGLGHAMLKVLNAGKY